MLTRNTAGLCLVFFLSAFAVPCRALYFLVTPVEERCFVEEVPKRTLVVGEYQNPQFEASSNIGIDIIARDIDDKELMRVPADVSGRFAFTSEKAGVYQICLKVNMPTTMKNKELSYKFHLAIQVGVEAQDYNKLIRKEHLSDIEVQVVRLTDEFKTLLVELDYQRKREEAFRDTSESTCERVMWWSILQMVVMIASAVFQSQHLKNYFEAKKLR